MMEKIKKSELQKRIEVLEDKVAELINEKNAVEEPQYQAGTLGAFWDGDWDDEVNCGGVFIGYFECKKEDGFRAKKMTSIWQNFKPLKFD